MNEKRDEAICNVERQIMNLKALVEMDVDLPAEMVAFTRLELNALYARITHYHFHLLEEDE